MILYEYPFNERIRTYLRLEHLLNRATELVSRESPVDHHYALATLFEIMDVSARADLKSDVLRDIEKQKHNLNGFRGNPAISEAMLNQIIAQLETLFIGLNSVQGKVGQSLTENEWLMSVRSRMGIPGGTCEFDLPAYCAWQHLDCARRQQDLHSWLLPIQPLGNAIRMLLKLLRDAGVAQKILAPDGQYQQNLPQGRSFQLLRLGLDEHAAWVPEISGNRLIVSVRVLRLLADGKSQALQEDASLELTLCA